MLRGEECKYDDSFISSFVKKRKIKDNKVKSIVIAGSTRNLFILYHLRLRIKCLMTYSTYTCLLPSLQSYCFSSLRARPAISLYYTSFEITHQVLNEL